MTHQSLTTTIYKLELNHIKNNLFCNIVLIKIF
jgi:hypothetical protein